MPLSSSMENICAGLLWSLLSGSSPQPTASETWSIDWFSLQNWELTFILYYYFCISLSVDYVSALFGARRLTRRASPIEQIRRVANTFTVTSRYSTAVLVLLREIGREVSCALMAHLGTQLLNLNETVPPLKRVYHYLTTICKAFGSFSTQSIPSV